MPFQNAIDNFISSHWVPRDMSRKIEGTSPGGAACNLPLPGADLSLVTGVEVIQVPSEQAPRPDHRRR
jgi:hypothetical protein